MIEFLKSKGVDVRSHMSMVCLLYTSATEVKSRLHETAYLNPELTIRFEDKRGAEVEDITYHEPDGRCV